MDYEIRKHFEAIIADLAKLFKKDRLAIRHEIKALLITKGLIKSSTNELMDAEFELLADRLHAKAFDAESHPLTERGELDLHLILFGEKQK